MAASTLAFPVVSPARLRREWQVIPISTAPSVREPEPLSGWTARHNSAAANRVSTRAVPVRRRMTREQGQALEKLAHAIEYLVDQGFILSAEPGLLDARMGDMQAISLLKRHSREMYESLPVRQPWWSRFFPPQTAARPVVVFPM